MHKNVLGYVFLAIASAAIPRLAAQHDMKTKLQARIGVVAIRAEGCHFVTDGGEVPTGSEITVIDPDSGAAPLVMRVTSRVKEPQWPQHPLVSFGDERPEPTVYGLDCSKIRPSMLIAFGVLAFQGKISRIDRGVVGKFSGSGAGEYAYRCTGSESLQFIIRSLDRRRLLWRAAYYLGYDTEPNCSAEDLK